MRKRKSPLTFKNPKIKEYRKLVQTRGYNNLDTLFCNQIYNDFVTHGLPSESLDFFKSKIRGTALVDPGCGLAYKNIVEVAKKLLASKYIGIDQRGKEVISNDQTNHLAGAWKFKGDMLEVIAQLESENANFIINGIDTEILETCRNEDSRLKSYIRYIGEEITRVTKPGGLVFGINFYPIEEELVSFHEFKKIDPSKLKLISYYSILEKKS